MYYSKCPEPNCDEDYLDETGRRTIKRGQLITAEKISNLTYLIMH